jgi:hypothetical protein
MSQECVVGVYDSPEKARDAVEALERSQFSLQHVSLVGGTAVEALRKIESLKYGDDAETKAAEGAGLGGLAGILLAAPLLAIPGVGPLLVAGPLAAAGLTGAVVGGFLGSMRGWGVHDDHVTEFEQKVRSGHFLVIVSGDPQEIALAKKILDNSDAGEVRLYARTSADSPEIDDTPGVRKASGTRPKTKL